MFPLTVSAFKTSIPLRKQKGITLIEILIVLAIIGLLMGLGIGAWKKIKKSKIRSAAYDLVMALNHSGQRCIAEGKPYRLMYDMEKNLIELQTEQQKDESNPNELDRDLPSNAIENNEEENNASFKKYEILQSWKFSPPASIYRVYTAGKEEFNKQGYIYLSPQGKSSSAIFCLGESEQPDLQFTVIFNNGRVQKVLSPCLEKEPEQTNL